MTRQPEHVYLELLVLRCQSGDVGAFEELVARWQPRPWRHALRYLDELSVVQIAVILDIPAGTVKSRLHHARNHLEHALERVAP